MSSEYLVMSFDATYANNFDWTLTEVTGVIILLRLLNKSK